jgi:hypothetical protein
MLGDIEYIEVIDGPGTNCWRVCAEWPSNDGLRGVGRGVGKLAVSAAPGPGKEEINYRNRFGSGVAEDGEDGILTG